MKPKFRIGDVVRRVSRDNDYGDGKILRNGTICTVKNYRDDNWIVVEANGVIYDACDPRYFELVAPITKTRKIIITSDGVHTTEAALYEGGKKVKTVEAKCCPEDKFDFMVGANLAMSRLTEAVEKSKYYSGKMVCVKSAFPKYWTVGKVYTVVEGTVRDNTCERGFIVESEKEARHMGSSLNEFIPLVED